MWWLRDTISRCVRVCVCVCLWCTKMLSICLFLSVCIFLTHTHTYTHSLSLSLTLTTDITRVDPIRIYQSIPNLRSIRVRSKIELHLTFSFELNLASLPYSFIYLSPSVQSHFPFSFSPFPFLTPFSYFFSLFVFPLFSIRETLDGLSTIRAYKSEKRFRAKNDLFLDNNQKAFFLNFR